jgi:hypothetical protein
MPGTCLAMMEALSSAPSPAKKKVTMVTMLLSERKFQLPYNLSFETTAVYVACH